MKRPISQSILRFLAAFMATAIVAFPLGQICLAEESDASREFQKGMCYAAWDKYKYASPYSDKALENLAKTGANWVSIVTTWYQKDAQTTSIYPTNDTPADKSIRHAIKKAKELGLKVMLKPHVDLIDTQDGAWRGEIFFYTEDGWREWFAEYRMFVTHYALLAEEEGVDIFCIGTELSATIDRKEDWKDTIRAVRKLYKGRLTYAANWDNEFDKIGFWNDLDYAGIDAYFPLSGETDPTFEEIKKGWDNWIGKIESWAKPLGKPILFTEVGYSSTSSAAGKPWEANAPGAADVKIQAKCYRALLETVWGKEWLAGIYWWHWNTNPQAGGPNNKEFTPQNKPAQDVLAEWYKK
jgi:hypothetical protein